MDVLLHSSYVEQGRVAGYKANTSYYQSMQTIANQLLSPNTAADSTLWELIPTLPTGCTWSNACCYSATRSSGTVCVYDASTYFVCGGACAWTVPAGASLARFQIIGPGGSTAGSNCCSVTPFGSSGAYGSVIIPVTPGDTYILCAGCSTPMCGCCGCLVPCNGFMFGESCPSFVTGPGLYNFCAMSGTGNLYEGMKARACSFGNCSWIQAGCCRYFSFRNVEGYTTCGGGCICATNGTICGFGTSSGGNVETQADWIRGVCGCAEYGIVYRVPSLHQSVAFDTSLNGTVTNIVPMPEFNGSNYCCYVYANFAFSGSTCNPRCMGIMWCNNNNVVFGSGGSWSVAYSGCTGDCSFGDRGRGGFAMVQWM